MSGKGRPYWLLLDDQPQGAFSWDQLLKMLQEDRIKSETLFSFCRAPEWKPLSYLLPPESLAERQTRNLVRKFIRECDHGPDRLVEEKEDPWFGYTSYTLTERQLSEFLDMAAVDNAASSDRLVLPSLKYSGDFDACMERISALNPERYRYFKTSFHGTKIWEVRGEYEGVPEREALGSAEKADEGDASVDSKKPKRAKPDSFFLLQDGEVQGPFTKDELEVRFYAGQIGSDVPYAYDRARRWRPLSHLFGNPSPEKIRESQVYVQRKEKRYFISKDGQTLGPHSYFDLLKMMEGMEITHQTLFATEQAEEWKPLAKLPVPHIPGEPCAEDIPQAGQKRSVLEYLKERITPKASFGLEISISVSHGFYLWLRGHPQSDYANRMKMCGPYREEALRAMLSAGQITPETGCAREGSTEWLAVRDWIRY